MPRPKKEGAPEPKKRSRHGCWPCKTRKIKCGEEKPSCLNCERQGEVCDYSIRLNWEGRGKNKSQDAIGWSSEHITLSGTGYSSKSQSPAPSNASTQLVFKSPKARLTEHKPAKSPPSSHPSIQAFKQSQTSSTFLDPRLDQPVTDTQGTKRKRQTPDTPETNPESVPSPAGQSSAQPNYSRLPGSPYSFPQNALGPPTPASDDSQIKSSANARSLQQQQQQQQQIPQQQGVRRLSVQYLLQSPSQTEESSDFSQPGDGRESYTVYGYDQGLPDIDLPLNDDPNALMIQSPDTVTRRLSVVAEQQAAGDDLPLGGFGFGLHAKESGFDRDEYYARPVTVKIPRYLEPLPAKLLENPMNMLYFHHFLNHTARILVPHDCPENPFRNVLPQMAASNENLLNLLLAYAASHRARLLNHMDPKNRIALLVRDVFSSLSNALNNNDISDANLATAIMLASLEIISPNAFEVPVSWQKHLTIARQMIIGRGGFQALQQKGKGPYFLGRWFAYLDVVGSLSGSNYDRPLQYTYCSDDGSETADDDSEIDCLLGFTNGCISILARVADLARQCDSQRIGLGGAVLEEWRPSADIVSAAENIKQSLQAARPTVFRGCAHRQPDTTDATALESFEMIAINDAFHWAGLIHLYRRVLAKRPSDEEVQICVREIVASADRIRPNGTAEVCMIFPMFTAGCEAIDPAQRDNLMNRLTLIESYGMTQVGKARKLMESVWRTGKPWETLVSGEFFG